MFSSWDLVRPRFWYPMSSLEQSMMELEQLQDIMMRPRSLFDMPRDFFAATKYAQEEDGPVDDDFFVDLPVVSHMYKRKPFDMAFKQDEKDIKSKESTDNVCSDTNSMEVDDEGSERVDQAEESATKTVEASKKVEGNVESKEKDLDKKNEELQRHSDKITSTTKHERDDECHNFSSYSFSSSSVMDDKGRRVTTTRRRYEDSSGRLKAVHEREIDGKKLRTTWHRQCKEDEGKHESICSSGSPEEFETLWQQTPFGEAQKKTVKGQLQSESDVVKEDARTNN